MTDDTGGNMRRLTAPYILTLVVLNGLIGTIRVTESHNRTQSIAYKYAKQILPMHAWGLVYLGVAALIAVAAYFAARWLWVPLLAGFAVWLAWTLFVFIAAYHDGKSSFVGPIFYGAGAIRHLQVLRRR